MYITSTNSTNTLLQELIASGNPPDYIYAGHQTAGRGQTGNRWESEADKNLLCSILLPPRANVFDLNVIVSTAVHQTISDLGIRDLTIKWPNDIYWQDKKLAGILIENAIVGSELKYSIAGIGLNVNQTEWHSDAPNPVSLKQITGKTFDLDELMRQLYAVVQQLLQEKVWTYYKTHLYRREGYWPFVEREVSIAPTMNADTTAQGRFMARIEDVLPTGEIILRDEQNQQRKYHFKQIRYIL